MTNMNEFPQGVPASLGLGPNFKLGLTVEMFHMYKTI